jgi:hypothetical protein
MTALTDPISGLSYGWTLGEDNWNTGMDANLVQLGATLNINVEDFVASPTVTTNGTRYLVTTGSGAFVSQDGKLAARIAGAWVFYTVPEGCIIYRKSNTSHYKRESGSNVLVVDLSSYLTSSTAASTYQTQAGMSSYLTTATASSTYGTIAQAKTEYLVLAASDESTALTTGTSKVTFRVPYAFTVSAVRASLSTAQASGSIVTVDINDSGTTILSTKLTIDNTEKTSTTAATAAVISDSALADDAEITIDIDQVGDGTAKGLKITLIGTRA